MAQAPNPVDAADIQLDTLVQEVDGTAAVAAVVDGEPQNVPAQNPPAVDPNDVNIVVSSLVQQNCLFACSFTSTGCFLSDAHGYKFAQFYSAIQLYTSVQTYFTKSQVRNKNVLMSLHCSTYSVGDSHWIRCKLILQKTVSFSNVPLLRAHTIFILVVFEGRIYIVSYCWSVQTDSAGSFTLW